MFEGTGSGCVHTLDTEPHKLRQVYGSGCAVQGCEWRMLLDCREEVL